MLDSCSIALGRCQPREPLRETRCIVADDAQTGRRLTVTLCTDQQSRHAPEMGECTGAHKPPTGAEMWWGAHPPVFTQGLAGRAEHLRGPGDIPVVRTERGGQVTYHGPGQVVAYTLIDLRRRSLLIRDLVCRLEQAAIDTLAGHGVSAVRRSGAPGVYVADAAGRPGAKIAALGIKVSRGCSYHGVALNVDMDLEPFTRIDPCGYPGLEVTDLRSCLRRPRGSLDIAAIAARFGDALAAALPARCAL